MRRIAGVALAAALAGCGGGGNSGSAASAAAPTAAAGGTEAVAGAAPAPGAANASGGGNFSTAEGNCSITVPDGWVAFGRHGRMDPSRHEFRALLSALNGATVDQAVQMYRGMSGGNVISDDASRTIISGTVAGNAQMYAVSKTNPVCSVVIAVPAAGDEAAARAIADSLNGH